MFTGLVEFTGILRQMTDTPEGCHILLDTPILEGGAVLGESIAVNGCCLTVAGMEGGTLRFDLLRETLARTNLGALPPGSRVNLERALAANARLGGHFVQGHVDCTAVVLDTDGSGADLGLNFELSADFARYIVEKGAIAINGVSLTVSGLKRDRFGVWIIPHTRSETNLGDLRAGDVVNLEFDLLAKYTERLLAARP
jgi:riboflavin synthase